MTDAKFVIPQSGVFLREEASQNGRIITKIASEEEVRIVRKDSFDTINHNEGYWVFVKYKTFEGYLFDAHVGHWPKDSILKKTAKRYLGLEYSGSLPDLLEETHGSMITDDLSLSLLKNQKKSFIWLSETVGRIEQQAIFKVSDSIEIDSHYLQRYTEAFDGCYSKNGNDKDYYMALIDMHAKKGDDLQESYQKGFLERPAIISYKIDFQQKSLTLVANPNQILCKFQIDE
ncbi:SH3 domain-containing protein [Leptospira johnsonii]|uniref:SH3b domain-containing protein n=1 Tax=Leptospira johnsonii TaxID=1917820 RepID=A0A2P2D7L7_9LEPT|nr:SH3 domain-containing protein [Leptospira johnsonii]GBF40630.1 hypothetical protein LPTSP1_36480 [Leptospira johnsonii]